MDESDFPELEPGVFVVFEAMLPPVVAAGDGDAHVEVGGDPGLL